MEIVEGKKCKNCNYFRQHYIWRYGYMKIEAGHCVHPPRTRRCRPELKACEKWLPQDEKYLQTYQPPATEAPQFSSFW